MCCLARLPLPALYQIMAEKTPSRHAGLVTFNGEVSIIGDGSGDARVVAGDRLSDAEALREVGRAYPLSRPVSEARDRLKDRLFALEEGGATALGPAVVAGLSMLKVCGIEGVTACVGEGREKKSCTLWAKFMKVVP